VKTTIVVIVVAAVAFGVYWFLIRPRRQLAGQAATSQAISAQGVRAVLGGALGVLRRPPLAVAA
jgi:hypothetical protein